MEFASPESVERAVALQDLPPQIGKVERSIPKKDHEHKLAKARADAPGIVLTLCLDAVQ